MCARVHVCVFVFAEEAERFHSVMVTLLCLSLGLWIFFHPSLPKAVKCSNKFHVCSHVFALWRGFNNTENVLSIELYSYGLATGLTSLHILREIYHFWFVKEKKSGSTLIFFPQYQWDGMSPALFVSSYPRKSFNAAPETTLEQRDTSLWDEKVTEEEFHPGGEF